jgi:hypothetical protein
MNYYHPSYQVSVLSGSWDSTDDKDAATYKRRFHDLGAESSTSIAKEPERTKFPKRTVLGIIQNQGGTPTDQAKDRQVTEAEKIKVSHKSHSIAALSHFIRPSTVPPCSTSSKVPPFSTL